MPLRVHRARERDWWIFVNGSEGGDTSRLFLPLFHCRRIAHNLDLPLVIDETHSPAKALLVKIAQLRLVTVMVGWTKQGAAKPAARDVGKVAFERLRLDDLDLVEIILGKGECAILECLAISRNGSVFAQLKERRLRRRGKLHMITLGFFEKHARHRVYRVGNGPGFDLRDDV